MEEVQGFLNQMCQIHKGTKICFSSLKANNANPFLCSTCLIKQKQALETLVSIEEVISTDLRKPIENWPPNIDTSSLEFLKNKPTDMLKEEMQKQIIDFYDKIKSEINQILLDSQKNQLLELEKIQIGSIGLMDKYNTNFKRQDLVNIFANQNNLSKDQYMNLINSINETSKNDLDELSKEIKERKQNELDFRLSQEVEFRTIADNIISKFNEFAAILIPEKGQSELFEDYDYCQFPTYTTYMDSYSKFFNLTKELCEYHYKRNKSRLLIMNDETIKVKYLKNSTIIINNLGNIDGEIFPYFNYEISDKVSFKLKFDSLISLKNLSFSIFLKDIDDGCEFSNLFEKLCSHFESTESPQIVFKIYIDVIQDFLQVTTEDGWNEKQQINISKENERRYDYRFYLNKQCESFEISEYQLID